MIEPEIDQPSDAELLEWLDKEASKLRRSEALAKTVMPGGTATMYSDQAERYEHAAARIRALVARGAPSHAAVIERDARRFRALASVHRKVLWSYSYGAHSSLAVLADELIQADLPPSCA